LIRLIQICDRNYNTHQNVQKYTRNGHSTYYGWILVKNSIFHCFPEFIELALGVERHQYYAEVFVNVGVIIAYQVRFDFFFVLFEIVFGEIQVINVERNGQYLGQQVVTP